MYSQTLLDHFQNPRNVGELPPPALTVAASNPVCGDDLRLSVRIEKGVVERAVFRALGCAASVAAGSMLTEIITGMAVDDLRRIRLNQIEEALGGLPPASRHAASLALAAIREVLAALPD